MLPELTESEKNLLRLIGENDGRYGLYRFHDRFVKFYRDPPHDFLLISKLGRMGLLKGLDVDSNTDDYQAVKIALSPLGWELFEKYQ